MFILRFPRSAPQSRPPHRRLVSRERLSANIAIRNGPFELRTFRVIAAFPARITVRTSLSQLSEFFCVRMRKTDIHASSFRVILSIRSHPFPSRTQNIPNTKVKLTGADDTTAFSQRESRTSPDLIQEKLVQPEGAFRYLLAAYALIRVVHHPGSAVRRALV